MGRLTLLAGSSGSGSGSFASRERRCVLNCRWSGGSSRTRSRSGLRAGQLSGKNVPLCSSESVNAPDLFIGLW